MGTYNGATYLPEQLESILNQDLAPAEMVVGDDGSTDDTLAILRDFSVRAPFPVQVTSNPTRLGYGENFIQAATRCTGDWIAFCDQDDVWLPPKLARCAEAIASGPPDLGLVVHGSIIGDRALTEIARTNWPKPGLYERLSLPPNWIVHGYRQVVRRLLLNEIPLKDRCIPWIWEPEAHDVWACLIASITGSVAVLDDRLAIYRRHETNTTEGAGLVPKTLLERIAGKIRDNSKEHKENADLYCVISRYLSDRANTQLTPHRRDQFLSASAQIAALGDRFAVRAQINPHHSLGERIRAFSALARSGAYSSKRGWGFGMAEGAIDLIRAILPNIARDLR